MLHPDLPIDPLFVVLNLSSSNLVSSEFIYVVTIHYVPESLAL
jgi:hypothetical protein